MTKSQYEIEVLVNGKPLKEYMHEGKVYVEGRKETTFSLRLRNNSQEKKLFIPTIDGLSVIDGKDASFDSGGYIVKPYSAMTVDGWRVSNAEVASFYFSSPKDSYRKQLKKGNNIGVIGCAVFSEKKYVQNNFFIGQNGGINATSWPEGSVTCSSTSMDFICDSYDVSAKNLSTSSVRSVSNDLGTGWGASKQSTVVEVEFTRAEYPAETFEIYYNTREQLLNIGVDFAKEPIYVVPQAFPGRYCPPPSK